ncbi:MAG: hypothetical protein QOE33_2274 [Acidobacteriota bacterium]|nr:hypothetical protein [Acidobacteriota bacterium]
MKKTLPEVHVAERARERGAALVLALLLSLLLLLVGGALITSTMMSATNMLDATPEVQAYYGAEAGLQASLLALRGNLAPNPLFVANPTGGIADGNKLDFRGAITPTISNLASDPTAAAFPTRLSRWLPYSYTPAGGAYADRVAITPGAYNPMNGIAYSLTVRDRDNSQTVTYSTTGTFNGGGTSVTFGSGANTVVVSYTPQPTTTVTAIPSISSGFGSFTVTRNGTGASAPSGTSINIKINVDAPYKGYIIMSGSISGSATNATCSLKITFSNISARVRGTLFTLSANPFLMNKPFGGVSTVTFPVQATVTAPEPERLLITSTGYGPRGARKVLTMEVSRFVYDIRPPAPVVIRGSDTAGDITTFDLGSSNAKFYSGKDAANIQTQLPTIAISLQDWTSIYNGLGKGSTVVDPKMSILDLDAVPNPWPATLTPVPTATGMPRTPPSAQTPDFLQTADAARTFLNELQSSAQNSSRYYTTFNGYADATNDVAGLNNPAFTFVDGDCTLSGGSGLLIVTGTLTMTGNDDFHGLVLVMGNGTVVRSGTGNGNVLGAWLVAKFPRAGTGGFTAPSFNVSGGGNGSFQFDTKAVDDALRTLGMKVVGVAET